MDAGIKAAKRRAASLALAAKGFIREQKRIAGKELWKNGQG